MKATAVGWSGLGRLLKRTESEQALKAAIVGTMLGTPTFSLYMGPRKQRWHVTLLMRQVRFRGTGCLA